MDISTKKVIFKQLIFRLFKDKDQTHINDENYLRFYKHIVSEMEEQSLQYIHINNEAKHFFFEMVIDIIENFSVLDFSEIKEILFSKNSFIHYVSPKIPVEISIQDYNVYLLSLEYKYRVWSNKFLAVEEKN
jgi:hypothetical protein